MPQSGITKMTSNHSSLKRLWGVLRFVRESDSAGCKANPTL